jgi:enoyl-CoA hydratase/carnithine racemase
VVAAINGPAIGAGLDLACMCDLRLAARGAQPGSTFVKVGLVPRRRPRRPGPERRAIDYANGSNTTLD